MDNTFETHTDCGHAIDALLFLAGDGRVVAEMKAEERVSYFNLLAALRDRQAVLLAA